MAVALIPIDPEIPGVGFGIQRPRKVFRRKGQPVKHLLLDTGRFLPETSDPVPVFGCPGVSRHDIVESRVKGDYLVMENPLVRVVDDLCF